LQVKKRRGEGDPVEDERKKTTMIQNQATADFSGKVKAEEC
jgi:hypothetical protein